MEKKMHNPVKLLGCVGVIISMLTLTACTTKLESPTPTPTLEASATPASSDTPAPTEAPAPTNIPDLASTISPTSTEPALPALTLPAVTAAAGATQPVNPPGSAAPEKAQFVTQNFADGYRFRPGTPVTIIWTVKNIGTVAWTSSYSLRYFSGEKSDKTSYPFPKTVAPGAEVELSINLVVPSVLGSYTTWWKLVNGQSQNFSDVDFHFEAANNPGAPLASPTP
jgi:hypothetical protein